MTLLTAPGAPGHSSGPVDRLAESPVAAIGKADEGSEGDGTLCVVVESWESFTPPYGDGLCPAGLPERSESASEPESEAGLPLFQAGKEPRDASFLYPRGGPRERHQGSAEDLELGILPAGADGGGREPWATTLPERVCWLLVSSKPV